MGALAPLPPTDPRGPLFLADQPLPALLLPAFFSFLILCSETAPKHLLCRLAYICHWWAPSNLLQEGDLRSFFSWRRLRYALIFFVWPFCLWGLFKIQVVFCGQKVVFMAQERLSSRGNKHTHYLRYIDKKEVFGWSVYKKHPRWLELGTLLKDHDANIMHQT